MALPPISSPASHLGALSQSQQRLQLALARLSTGQRLTKAADDPAGMVIAQQMQAQLAGIDQASDDTEQGMSLLQTADGGLEQTGSLLAQQRSLAVQAGNSALMDPDQLAVLNAQFNDLGKAVDQVVANTSFNGRPLLDGSYANQSLQVGPSGGQTLPVTIASQSGGGFDRQGLGLTGIDLSAPGGAADALDRLDAATAQVDQQREALGSLQADTLESNARSLATANENLQSARSTTSDADYAQEAANRVGAQIRLTAGIAALAQGNQSATRVLQLLTG